MRRLTTLSVGVMILGAIGIAAGALISNDDGRWSGPPPLRPDARILFSSLVPNEAPEIFRRYFRERDMARADTLPDRFDLERDQLYGLPTSLRREWMGFPGVRHWVDAGCGDGTPKTVVYDPEFRSLTPVSEQRDVVRSIDRAARMVGSTGCHDFGLAPGSSLLFGLDDVACSYDLDDSYLRDINWRRVDLVDVQSQRLLSDRCIDKDGIATYESAVSEVAAHVREMNPEILVLSQVSFRDNDPVAMIEGLQSVAEIVDGIYFSYPSNNSEIDCRYCTVENLEFFLSSVR